MSEAYFLLASSIVCMSVVIALVFRQGRDLEVFARLNDRLLAELTAGLNDCRSDLQFTENRTHFLYERLQAHEYECEQLRGTPLS